MDERETLLAAARELAKQFDAVGDDAVPDPWRLMRRHRGEGLDFRSCTTECIHMVDVAGTEVWQARIGREFAAQLKADAVVLGLDGRTDIVKAGLQLLHRHAAEARMARSVDEFYGASPPPLPIGVLPDDDGLAELAQQRTR